MDTIKKRYKIILLIIFIGFICFQIGVWVGTYTTIKIGIKLALSFMDIDIDEELIKQAILQYQEHIGNRFPLKPVK